MFTVPAHKQTDPAKYPGQIINRPAATPRGDQTIGDYVARKTTPAPAHVAIAQQNALLHWINTHDCGVLPCGVAQGDGSIVIRVGLAGGGQEDYFIRTLAEARDALGY